MPVCIQRQTKTYQTVNFKDHLKIKLLARYRLTRNLIMKPQSLGKLISNGLALVNNIKDLESYLIILL
jgi:hypothetical protein